MSRCVNKVMLIGFLGDDPKIITTTGGAPNMARFSLATSERWTDKGSGEVKQRTDWHKIVVIMPQIVKIVVPHLHKGAHICVEGALQNRKWKDSEGKEQFTTEVVVKSWGGKLTFLERKQNAGGQNASPEACVDDDIPF